MGGLAVAVAILAGGLAAERARYGEDPAATTRVLSSEVQQSLERAAAALTALSQRLGGDRSLPPALINGSAGSRVLFSLLNTHAANRRTDQAVTVYDGSAQALAWVGRPSSLPPARVTGGRALFVAPGPLGLRLVRVEPVIEPRSQHRIGSLVLEQVLSAPGGIGLVEQPDYTWPTSLTPVVLVPRYASSAPTASLAGVALRDLAGEPLIEVRVDESAVASARRNVRERIVAGSVLALIATLVLLGAPIDRWRRNGGAVRFTEGSLLLCCFLVGARVLLWLCLPAEWRRSDPFPVNAQSNVWRMLLLRSPVDLLAHAVLALGLVGVFAVAIDPLRFLCRARHRRSVRSTGWTVIGLVAHVLAGGVAAVLAYSFSVTVNRIVEEAGVDVLQLSLHPYDWPRLALLIGLVVLHAAILWGSATAMLAAAAVGPVAGTRRLRDALGAICWIAPSLAWIAVGSSAGGLSESAPWLLTVGSATAGALFWRRATSWFRHSSQAGRVVVTALAFVIPSLLIYPMLVDAADRTLRQRIEERFAGETLALPRILLARLDETRREIDRIAGLNDLLLSSSPGVEAGTEVAFSIWRRTALAAWRLTSAVEMYDGSGRLVSRFALNLPEYDPRAQQYRVATCRWGVFGEVTPFGAEERRMLHAERGICDAQGNSVGGVVVHVLLDYATLSFISSQNPYFEVLRGRQAPTGEAYPGRDVSLTIYGWGRTAIFTTTGRAWTIPDELFNRIYRSNQGFWTILDSGDQQSSVYFVSDRNGIYALGYPVSTWFDASVRLAELATLGAVVACFMLIGASLLQWLARPGDWAGHRLLRELRTSFSRKLFLSFVAATVIPVLILAIAIRAFVALRLRHDIEAEAARTAAVAQRVIEETLSLDRRAEVAPSALDDDALVWISRIINQDVNVYEGAQLLATSERDLFASGQLTTRTPEAVYQALVIDRLPAFIGEDDLAGLPYLMAAAPVRSGAREALLTVPFTLRQREIEREIDELDRGVQLGAIAFILLGAAIGYWLAERISDPVQRLTRASRRIAAGDLDTRVFVRSADELRRLVEAFNKMAWELQRQRAQLERTNRLEAWAEMARQVAHDIKNPLTPIQLSAEHLRRVHQDRGEPLSPVLDACIDTILAQVRLLRQIASEFSSFASTPVPHPISTDISSLVHEIVGAYATGLAGRVIFDVHVAPDVPVVLVDRALVGRALTNVVENALHAMPSGGRVTIDARADRDRAVITISDTGVGMDEEALSRIFEPYFSTKASGTGLGLTIAKRNVELHGGTIGLTSQRGLGTRVTVTLPASAKAVPD